MKTALHLRAGWAREAGVEADFDGLDIEREGQTVLQARTYSMVLVFRYLHRPLIPAIKQAIKPGGLMVYETYTVGQRKFGKPRSADFLLEPGELKSWFGDWDILHAYEGEMCHPRRAIAQIICRKPQAKAGMPGVSGP